MRPTKPLKFVERKVDSKVKVIRTKAGAVIEGFKARPDVAAAWMFNKVLPPDTKE